MRSHFITSTPTENLFDADQLMRFAHLRQMIIAQDGILVGLLTQRPMLEARAMALWLRSEKDALEYLRMHSVREVMLPPPKGVEAKTSLGEAANQLLAQGIACLPVVEPTTAGPRLIGLVTESDLLKLAYR